MSTNWNQVKKEFQRIWGYEDFRPPQGEIIRCLLASKDSLIVLPTGGGKSICFQLPALLQTGLTLVISPLVALMENQVRELQNLHLPAALLHSQLPVYQRKQTLKAIENQRLRLLYLSPETLLSPPVWERISQPQIKINGLILDEAHCLVQWGDTFRPAYRRLGVVRPALLKSKPRGTKIPIAAFTATADPTTQKIIGETLKLRQPQVFLTSPYRENLHLSVQTIWTPRGRRQRILKFVKAKSQQSGLVYVRSRRDSEELANFFTNLGYQTAAYHAGLAGEQRREIENNWLTGKTQFVICTCAFGMGINKPDVRWIIHFQAPLLLAEYIQEIGRGGRDGKPAEALTLISEPTGWLNPEDKQRNQFFADKLNQLYRQAQQTAKNLPLRGEIKSVSKEFRSGEITLSLLHSAGEIEWIDPFHYQRKNQVGKLSFANLNVSQQQYQGQMKAYFTTKECRWQYLLNAFGFTQQAEGFKCDRCDNCQRKAN